MMRENDKQLTLSRDTLFGLSLELAVRRHVLFQGSDITLSAHVSVQRQDTLLGVFGSTLHGPELTPTCNQPSPGRPPQLAFRSRLAAGRRHSRRHLTPTRHSPSRAPPLLTSSHPHHLSDAFDVMSFLHGSDFTLLAHNAWTFPRSASFRLEKMATSSMGNKKIATTLGLSQSTTKRWLQRVRSEGVMVSHNVGRPRGAEAGLCLVFSKFLFFSVILVFVVLPQT